MKLYIGKDLITEKTKVMDLESALIAVKALGGRKDLRLVESDDGAFLIVGYYDEKPGGFLVWYFHEKGDQMVLAPTWKTAADCARRFLAGRRPFREDLPEDDCPLCEAGL